MKSYYSDLANHINQIDIAIITADNHKVPCMYTSYSITHAVTVGITLLVPLPSRDNTRNAATCVICMSND